MERWVTLVLALLVIVVGFIVVQSIIKGQNQIGDAGSAAQCFGQGGTCQSTESCDGEDLGVIGCGEGRICCGAAS